MPSPTAKYQQYQCPEEFSDRLNEVGGFNRYDEPNFILRWAQGGEDECYFRAGGAWNVEGLPSFKGYRDLLVGGGTPSWMLMQWQAPELYGTPEIYYMRNKDPGTGLQDLGSYPYSGRYVMLYNLRWTERRGNKLYFEAMPLNSLLLNTIVPIIMAAKDISWEKTKAVLQDIEIRENARDIDQIEDIMRASAVPFKGSPVSYGKQGCRTSLIDKKIEVMQRNWNKMMTNAKSLGKGLSQREV
jgi:hypothetical protein